MLTGVGSQKNEILNGIFFLIFDALFNFL